MFSGLCCDMIITYDAYEVSAHVGSRKYRVSILCYADDIMMYMIRLFFFFIRLIAA